jgi:hypothetical protein
MGLWVKYSVLTLYGPRNILFHSVFIYSEGILVPYICENPMLYNGSSALMWKVY